MRSENPSSDSVSAAAYDADQSVVTEENHRDRRSRRHRQHNYAHHESEEETDECSSNSDDSSFNTMDQGRTTNERSARDRDGHKTKGSSSSNKHHPTKGESSLPSAKKNNDDEQESTGVCCQKKYIAAAVLAIALLACAIGAILLFTGGARSGSDQSPSSAFDFGSLTESPTAQPTISPKPSPEPTKMPSRSPTPQPTSSPTPRPTEGPTQSPTKRPSQNPTPVPPPPTVSPPTVRGHDTFSFYVMGDVPYSDAEEKILEQQLKDIDRIAPMDDAQFIVHVGDVFKRGRYECIPKTYQNVANKFIELSPIPTIVLPGDNDIYDCDDWREAEELWESTFLNFEQNWNARSNFPATVLRQDRSQENFSFTYADVLFIGMNIIASSEGETREKQDDRYDACMEWMEAMVTAHVRSTSDLRAVVFFGHADKFNDIFERAEELLAHTKVPALYIHGNGHEFEMERPITGWDEYLRIQVDQGGEAPPLKVTIKGTTAEAMDKHFFVPFADQHLHTPTIKLDRQGGRYSDS